ncbi:MAG: cytochrome c3 family protein, partial [Pseudomonadota bacterium]
PRCGSCHKVSFDLEDLIKPRLLAVYHLECLGCHEKMKLKQGCTDCHAEKPKDEVASKRPES